MLSVYGVSVLVSQTSFRGEIIGGNMQCQLFSQATVLVPSLGIIKVASVKEPTDCFFSFSSYCPLKDFTFNCRDKCL